MKTCLFTAIILMVHWVLLLPAMAHNHKLNFEVSDVTFYQNGEALLFGGLVQNKPYLKIMDRKGNGELSTRSPFYLDNNLYQGFATAMLVESSTLTQNAIERPVLFGHNGVYTIVGTEVVELIRTASIYRSIDDSAFRLLPHALDVNNDGLTDFVIPNFESTSIWTQKINGSFKQQVLDFSLPTEYYVDEFDRASLFIEVPKQVIQAQVIGNELVDLVVVFDDQILIIEAISAGLYASQAGASGKKGVKPIEVRLPFALKSEHAEEQNKANGTTYKLLDVQDLNNDGIVDLIIDKRYFDGTDNDVGNEEQSIIVLFGALKQSELFYAKTNSDEIKLGGEMLDYGFADFNGDGRKDLYYVSGEIGAGSVMSALFGGGFEVDIRVHLQREGMNFTTKVKAEKETQFLVDVKNVAFGTFLEVADINHDGKDDLILKESERYLSVYLGNAKRVLAKKAQKIKMSLPENPAKIKRLRLGKNHFVVSYEKLDRLVQIKLD
ncbi:VCBS repeat-containing protein [Psychrosphaera sp. B3R10]|uniref:FG-GAP repeat domain-containing protein n=1 Tax=unclassified Psychrosphaera TaxID=2641570 RepID=UPI001C08468A|nr:MULTISPECIES: VCBS repeat-containing protein [unclassified Psychrosphaera]MBU2881880.1 VCBS repeat-containing protein [Psychrosphaera sp. I2R16]MBU2989901.1 VCBS repeat-containing protein [Psychrosphaera sp. B3R10]